MIMDSVFCVLGGILKMRKRGYYGSTLIKKRRYWPRGIHGDEINEYFSTKNIGDVGCLSGEWDETEFNIFVMKEPDYNMVMISTFSGFTVPEGQKEERSMVDGEVVKFKYPAIVADHYRYRGAVENCNTLRHDGGEKAQIVLESAWGTT